jgi:hypothetical protein
VEGGGLCAQVICSSGLLEYVCDIVGNVLARLFM